jgi:hypothetical protein
MSRARKLARDVERYAAFGYVTEPERYQQDDAKLLRGIDRLYDAQRAEGLADDVELTEYRTQLRAAWSHARNVAAPAARASLLEGQAGAVRRRAESPGMQGYLDELKISRAKGQL